VIAWLLTCFSLQDSVLLIRFQLIRFHLLLHEGIPFSKYSKYRLV
jgi:hypothetical protein